MTKFDALDQELEFGDIVVTARSGGYLSYGIYVPNKALKLKLRNIDLKLLLDNSYHPTYNYFYYVFSKQAVKYPFDKTNPDYIKFLNELKKEL